MSALELDFVVYEGDPDDGASAFNSKELLSRPELKEINFPEVYGAITMRSGSEELAERKPDPILQLITNFVKRVRYVLEGEPETVLLSESAHGFLFEPSGDDVLISFFSGDPYEPDELLVEHATINLDTFGEQVLSMGERLVEIMKKASPDFFEQDDYASGLVGLLEEGRKEHRTLQLKAERGLRPS